MGSLPPGAFKDGESLTQQKIKARIKEIGFQDPLFAPASSTRAAGSVAGAGSSAASWGATPYSAWASLSPKTQ